MSTPSRIDRIRARQRRKTPVALNLVSLMDIFTILVFFLLVNSTNVQLPNSDSVKLPQASAEKLPEETIVVAISADEIIVQGRRVATISEVMLDTNPLIPGLHSELKRLASRKLLVAEELQGDKPLTVVGDRDLPYALLKKILRTAMAAEFGQVSLAVVRKAPEKGVTEALP